MECFACIHCHFYQPPRENPWLEVVESQDSASPFHDWNERIARECYLPNGASRILNDQHRITSIVNNYARISFNFGPTLLSWMEEHAPDGYQRILDGDRESRRLFSGHGAALAQAYNHTILPLSNRRDKRTQILWGIKDFQHRFRRDPEGMWLPETAVDLETLELLSDEGIKFTILAPRQARQLRVSEETPWIDLENGIDSRRAYVCSLSSGRNIRLFFYDGAVSTAVAFGKLLFSGENFAHRLLSRFDPEGDSAQLMHIATDGETYGHHHPNGDMALAYALHCIEEKKLARLTNYGEYLALHPPSQEVRIRERSSWSCAHGVGRWESDCGCNSGAHPRWNQSWRRPLRQAFDWVRDGLAAPYETAAQKLFHDPWLARDEYIDVVLDRSSDAMECFLTRWRTHDLSFQEEMQALRLLEMQRHLMLMYTSCGWFFDEPTGPETVQVLQYAGRAVQLGEQLFGGEREPEFLQRLEAVRTNIAGFENGRDIYERFVRPAMLDLPGVAAHYVIRSFFDGFHQRDSIYCYGSDLKNLATYEDDGLKLSTGTARITSNNTHAQLEFNFAVLYLGGHDLRSGICQTNDEFDNFVQQTRSYLSRREVEGCSRLFEFYFGNEIYSLGSLLRDERRRVVDRIVESTLTSLDKLYGKAYEQNTGLISFLSRLGMVLPPMLRLSSEIVLNNAIRRTLSSKEMDTDHLQNLLRKAAEVGISIDASLKSAFRERIDRLMARWADNPLQLEALVQIEPLVSLMRVPTFESDLWSAQNTYYDLMCAISSLEPSCVSEPWLDLFRSTGDMLGIVLPQPFPPERPSAGRQLWMKNALPLPIELKSGNHPQDALALEAT